MVIASLQLSFLSHKNLLLVNDVDASWKTLERVAYLLTLEVVNHNIIVCTLAHRVLTLDFVD